MHAKAHRERGEVHRVHALRVMLVAGAGIVCQHAPERLALVFRDARLKFRRDLHPERLPRVRGKAAPRLRPAVSVGDVGLDVKDGRPRELGRKGERVAKTPMRALPPRRGGRTVGEKPSVRASENCQISQRWLKPSIPRRASVSR